MRGSFDLLESFNLLKDENQILKNELNLLKLELKDTKERLLRFQREKSIASIENNFISNSTSTKTNVNEDKCSNAIVLKQRRASSVIINDMLGIGTLNALGDECDSECSSSAVEIECKNEEKEGIQDSNMFKIRRNSALSVNENGANYALVVGNINDKNADFDTKYTETEQIAIDSKLKLVESLAAELNSLRNIIHIQNKYILQHTSTKLV